jgi:hypothetical protein
VSSPLTASTNLNAVDHAPGISGLRALVSPSFAAFIFVILPGMVFYRPTTMLTDPGVGWHLKTGEYILTTGTIPHNDLFSFTMPAAAWTTYEWLFQLLAASLEALGGLPLLTASSALVYASLPVLLYRSMVRDRANVAVAALLSILSVVLFAAHAHARPHILTYLFFFFLADRLTRYRRGEVSAASLAWFVPITALWANLHGGFVVGPVLVGLYLVGAGVRYVTQPLTRNAHDLKVYTLLGAGMGVASLLNPAGWNLHFSILEYLTSDSLALMTEYQSPDFKSGVLFVVIFELMILGLVVLLGARRSALDPTECIVLVFFLHQSLSALRHIFLFAIIAIPIVARELTAVLDEATPQLREVFDGIAMRQKSLRSDSLYFALISIVFLTSSVTLPGLFKADLDDIYLSGGAAEFIEARTGALGRMFNSPSLGGALVYRFWPEARIFGDDRNDFYGDDFFINKYYRVLSARPDWQDILDEYEVTSAIVLEEDVVGELFRTSPKWRLSYQDDKNSIFSRID